MGLFSKKKLGPGNPVHTPIIAPVIKEARNSFDLFLTLDKPFERHDKTFPKKWKDEDDHTWELDPAQAKRDAYIFRLEYETEFIFQSSDGDIKFTVEISWSDRYDHKISGVKYNIQTGENNRSYSYRSYEPEKADSLPIEINEIACRVFLVLDDYLKRRREFYTKVDRDSESDMCKELSRIMGGRMISNPDHQPS